MEQELEEPLLAELYSASVQGRGVQAERGEKGVRPLGRRRDERPLSLPGELCASLDGFSLHAKVALEADDNEGRERLARYLARPPIASERLSLADAGRVVYRLCRHWKDGTRAVVFDPLDFITRLAALVPRPRTHLLTYHGVLAPAAEWRDWVVPRRAALPPLRSITVSRRQGAQPEAALELGRAPRACVRDRRSRLPLVRREAQAHRTHPDGASAQDPPAPRPRRSLRPALRPSSSSARARSTLPLPAPIVPARAFVATEHRIRPRSAFQTWSSRGATIQRVGRFPNQPRSSAAMEATGVYWKPVWHVLEGAFDRVLANAATHEMLE